MHFLEDTIKNKFLVRIKPKARFWQDFSIWEWPEDNHTIFEAYYLYGEPDQLNLTAPGFGDKDNYGNGSIFISDKNVMPVEF